MKKKKKKKKTQLVTKQTPSRIMQPLSKCQGCCILKRERGVTPHSPTPLL